MKILLFANTDWYLYNFRRSLAAAIREKGHQVVLVSPAGPYGEKLRALGFTWHPAPMQRRSLNPMRELALVLWIRRLIKEEHVDLVHGFTVKCAVYGSLAGRLAGVQGRVSAIAGLGYVFTSTDARASVLKPIVSTLFRLALGGDRARLILQNPDDVALFEGSKLVHPDRIRLIPGSGVDCSRFTPPEQAPSEDSFRVLLPARLLWDKGIAEFVEAARMLKADGVPIRFLLAGEPDDGNPASIPATTIRDWVSQGLVEWLGHVTDMPGLFRSVHVVVLPSYREGLPKGLIEAAACGLPLITTDVPGCREVVRDGTDGLLIPARDAQALAKAIHRLQSDPLLRKRLGAAARSRAMAEFDEKIVISRTLQVYDEVLQVT